MSITKMCVVPASDRHIFFGQFGEKKKQTLLLYCLQSRLNLIYCLPLSDHGHGIQNALLRGSLTVDPSPDQCWAVLTFFENHGFRFLGQVLRTTSIPFSFF
jgi:hypothetical protein